MTLESGMHALIDLLEIDIRLMEPTGEDNNFKLCSVGGLTSKIMAALLRDCDGTELLIPCLPVVSRREADIYLLLSLHQI